MSAAEPAPRVRYKGRAAFGLAIAILGGAYVRGSMDISAGPGYAAVGPSAFPIAIGVGLVLSGLAVLVADLRGTGGNVPDERADWKTLGAMVALLAGYIAVYEPLGFVAATAVMYALGARVLGSRRWGINVGIALALSLVVFAVFHYLLQVQLPFGSLWTR